MEKSITLFIIVNQLTDRGEVIFDGVSFKMTEERFTQLMEGDNNV